MRCVGRCVWRCVGKLTVTPVRGKVNSFISLYPVLRRAQSVLHFTSLTDLFNQTPPRLHLEAFSHAAINARRLLVHKYPPLL